MSSGEEDEPRLSDATSAALAEFLAAKAGEEKKQDEVSEDWQLSQFWYSAKTSEALAREAVRAAGPDGRIAFVSCPTALKALLRLGLRTAQPPVLLEFDERFREAYPAHFLPYDYKHPLALKPEFKGAFSVILVDPPFLATECLLKVAVTTRFLAAAGASVLLCTGAVMEEEAARLLDARPTAFRPRHANNLANDFRCFANYDCPLHNSNQENS